MSMERSRRARFTNVAPTAGEFKVAVLLAGLFFFLITPLVVQGGVKVALVCRLRLASGRSMHSFAWVHRATDGPRRGGLLLNHVRQMPDFDFDTALPAGTTCLDFAAGSGLSSAGHPRFCSKEPR